ncbi:MULTISPECIES: tRNA (5-methylaminomethyl-2-thiouridine)(34)-methyltransferase MnmD [unclassified Pedobacter]|uniref:tRNA (5-methylaminomethyl-2-thiouridine)(34)-methyltransferase MnmD n=1 Tax=unclassified Pedobacter TaxID=2628915 RepID=UPI001422BB3D|nr:MULTISPECIES: tRNA (5-methylaminomethyl-2-thiouridine)(34)-methyltransferase MnmD [unclassified Pedobacter]NII83899.1 tRNA U34 5-methylaminomethyl-2-thiouridine-forming methyltransferase MnmC [Pedobacter sp. SG908]NMN37773.1 tRNA U34 5-methylaminomethyl-2-thiouridine-forming methyltransferase MnmC [Pedobacter sp. SG918]
MNIITPTADGSNTLYNETIGEHYHSKHGALQESKHVFIDAGLKFASTDQTEISILEIGFGTGLNFILSFDYCGANNINLNYTSIEAFPLTTEVIEQTGYSAYVPEVIWADFISNYPEALKAPQKLTSLCTLEIPYTTLAEYRSDQKFDLIYYDAFSVQHQPEMWSDEIIAHACGFLKPGGTFVTYAITGKLKRAIKACGFTIEKLPGAPGKREMLRAIKG